MHKQQFAINAKVTYIQSYSRKTYFQKPYLYIRFWCAYTNNFFTKKRKKVSKRFGANKKTFYICNHKTAKTLLTHTKLIE